MKKSELRGILRTIVREEVAIAIKEVVNEIKNPTNTVSKEVKRKPVNNKQYTKNPILNEVINERKKFNNSVLKREKYNLIKEIKNYYDLQNFLSSKVRNYSVYASIYKLFEYNNISPIEKTESHFNLVEHVTTSNKTNIESSLSTVLPKDEDLRIITYQTLLEKFNTKHSNLNYPQKSLLRAYINNVSNVNSLKEYIEKVVPAIKKELKQYSNKLTDKVVKIKMREAIKSIDNFCGVKRSKLVKDNVVVQTMRYMELLKELKKSGNKNKKVI